MKFLTWIILVFLLYFSLFKINEANLTNNVLGVALMLLLITLFSDLKEFNFWGLWGKKTEKDLKELEGKQAIIETDEKIEKKDLAQAEISTPIQLMDTAQGNLLALAFEIERLLRIYATVSLIKDIPANINPIKLSKDLHAQGLLTDNGIKQLEAIRWLRNMIVHGRQSEINQATLETGITIAYSFYQELFNTLNQSR